jgi:hypothetical protein
LVARFAAARTGSVVISIDPALSAKAVKCVGVLSTSPTHAHADAPTTLSGAKSCGLLSVTCASFAVTAH